MAPYNFGEWLTARRTARSLTQQQLAEAAGCTRAYVSSLERGVIEAKSGRPIQPSREMVTAFANALRAPIAEALEAAGWKSAASPQPAEDEMLAYFRALPDEQRQDALALIRALHDRHAGQHNPEDRIRIEQALKKPLTG